MDTYDQIAERLKRANEQIQTAGEHTAEIRAFSCYEDEDDDLIVRVMFVLPDPPEEMDNWDADILDQLCAKAQSHVGALGFATCRFRTEEEFEEEQESDWVFIERMPADG